MVEMPSRSRPVETTNGPEIGHLVVGSNVAPAHWQGGVAMIWLWLLSSLIFGLGYVLGAVLAKSSMEPVEY
jgi:hypothetical protein